MWKFPTYEIGMPIPWQHMLTQFDWLADMQYVEQDSIWHAEGDVFTHTKMVIEALLSFPEYQALLEQEQHILFTAALLHDVEKRSTTTTEMIDGMERIVSPRHAKKGEFTTRTILYKDIPTPFFIRESIAKLVRYHGLPIWAIDKDDPRKAVIEASLCVNTKHLAMLAKADVIGRICQDQEDQLYRIALFEELCKEHQCFGNAYAFASDYGRYVFLNKTEIAPDYHPFEDLAFEVTVLCALPGTGKDTYIKKELDLPILSLDNIRRTHQISPTDKKKNGQVIQLAKEQAKVWMRKKESFVFNATNITKDMRSKWIQLFTDYKAKVKIIYLEVPYKQLIQQNKNRSYSVPSAVLEKLIHKLEIPNYSEAHEIQFVV